MTDTNTLLLKLGSAEVMTEPHQDLSGLVAFYAIIDISCNASVLGVYENNSPLLLAAYRHFGDFFHAAPGTAPATKPRAPALPSNSETARAQFERLLYTITTARNGGADTATRRALAAVLPVPSQNARISPFFDPALFDYDERVITPADRLKHASDGPVRFFRRGPKSGIAFRLHVGPLVPPRVSGSILTLYRN
jgi:hypothetical protein